MTASVTSLVAQQIAVVHQLRLTDSGGPEDGTYDVRLTLHDAEVEGVQFGEAVTNMAVTVVGGVATVCANWEQEFFDGSPRWLEIAVRLTWFGDEVDFETLWPRQLLRSVPQALFAERAFTLLTPLPAESLQGSYTNAVALLHPANQFGGDGSALTGVNAQWLGGLGASSFALADHRHADLDFYLLGGAPLPAAFWEANSNAVGAVVPGSEAPLPAGGTLWVDAITGSDETGLRDRLDRPFATPMAALREVRCGDVVRLRPGVYRVVPLYYTSDQGEIAPELYLKGKTNVTIEGYGAELVATGYGNILTIEGCRQITIRGLTFRGSEVGMGTLNICAAINHRGTNAHTTIRDCSFVDIPDQAISHCWGQLNRPSSYWTIQNCWFHNIGQTNHPGVGHGLPDGAMVSGRPRRLIFTGNRSSGRNVFGVELDGGGASAAERDPDLRSSVIANNVLEGIYWVGVLLNGTTQSPVEDTLVSGNLIAYHRTDARRSLTSALVVMAGCRNTIISGNILTAPTASFSRPLYGALVHNPYGDGKHATTQNLLFAANTVIGGAYGFSIAATVGVGSIVTGVHITGNTFRDQGEANLTLAGRGVQVRGNWFCGAGRTPLPTYPFAVRLWDLDGAPATGFLMRDNVLYDYASTPTTTRMLRTHSAAVPKTALDVANNRVLRMSGVQAYQLADGTPLLGNVTVLSDEETIVTDALEGPHFRVTLGDNRLLGNPVNPADGRRLTWELIQDETGGHTVVLGDKFQVGADFAGIELSRGAGQRDFLTAVYSSQNDKWHVVEFRRGY